ncbi:MAG: hypothetical protein Kow0069_35780 [Promethearchaeota archaeon]
MRHAARGRNPAEGFSVAKATMHLTNEIFGEREIEIDTKWSYGQVLQAVLEAYDVKERPKKVFIHQGEEIRDLTRDLPSRVPGCKSTLEEQFNYSKRIDLSEEVEVHFAHVPIIFQLTYHSIYGHRTIKKVLHLDPSITMNELREKVREEFGILDGLTINFVHQGFMCGRGCEDPTLEELDLDPRHVVVVTVDILKDMGTAATGDLSH